MTSSEHRTFRPFFEQLSELREQNSETHSKIPQFALVESFWHIGRLIVEEEQAGELKALYGDNLLDTLASELRITFGKGYTATNLRWARQLYLSYPIHHTTCDELGIDKVLNDSLSWSHYRTLLKISNLSEREFYIEQVAQHTWSVRFLQKMIDNDFFYTRNDTYSLPKQGQPQKAEWRARKTAVKNRGMAVSGWAFIHPKSFKVAREQLLFYQIVQKIFILLCDKAVSLVEEAKMHKTLKQQYGPECTLLLYAISKKGQIAVIAGRETTLLSDKILTQFNGSD
ncbi:MAG: hypothetical protein ACJAVW_001441 [Spirosomataceae bacterium]|jgi:hypothetical protein